MPAGQGLRARTRDMFSRSHRGKGVIPTTVFLRTFKLGDFVDIKVNSAVHGGMPFKWYHGKTGIVWNITKRAVGVEVNKQVGNRIIKKRLHVRIEHVIPSRCNELFHKRRLENDALKAEATKKGERLAEGALKRQPKGPRPAFTMQNVTMETVAPIPYDVIKEGLLS